MTFSAPEFTLVCRHCGAGFDPDIRLLKHDSCAAEPFLLTQYKKVQIDIDHNDPSLFRFSDWLPVRRRLENSAAPVTYRSRELASELGLENLFITFSGYWPERGADMRTGSFKECEAYSVCSGLPENTQEVLVVASAGNTARAFASVCSRNRIPLVVVIPEKNLPALWFDHELDPCVRIIAAGADSDYFDAIHLAGVVCGYDGFFPEGGARNVARRDGMGTTVLSAADHIGALPEHYFQAVGSGTGAIAAWEATERLRRDGRFGQHIMRIHAAQNEPFLLLKNAWERGSRHLIPMDPETARQHAAKVWASVLTNRQPPFSPEGGFFDAMEASQGRMYGVTNEAAHAAYARFLELEGIDIDPAAAVAVASLEQAVHAQVLDPQATIMLNVTGGGARRLRAEIELHQAQPSLIIEHQDINPKTVLPRLESLF